MAKKQTASSTEQSVAASGRTEHAAKRKGAQKPAVKGTAVKKATAKSAEPAAKRNLTQEEIGSVAGEVWHVLSQRGGQNVASLKKAIDAPGDVVSAAVGWLAREGKLEFSASGRSVKVSLR